MQPDVLKNRIAAGRGDVCADLVLKNARVINVFTNEIETADIAISGNYIVGVGEYRERLYFCFCVAPAELFPGRYADRHCRSYPYPADCLHQRQERKEIP